MHVSIDLLDKALHIKRAAAWAKDLNITEAAIAQAKKRNRLSPTLAGNLAMKLGENPTQWIALAALEAEPDSPYKTRLLAQITSL